MTITRIAVDMNLLWGGIHTMSAGTNRYLMVMQQDIDASAAQYNGVSMTELFFVDYTHMVQAWGLAIPDSWSGSLSLTITGGNNRIHFCEFAGVDPLTPILDTQVDGSGSSGDTSASVSILCDDNGWVEGIIDLSNTPTENANMTYDNHSTWTISYYTTPVDGLVTFSYTFSGSRNAMGVISLNPIIPGPVDVNSWNGLSMISVEKLDALVKANIKTIDGLG
jgi:hypothetical protein